MQVELSAALDLGLKIGGSLVAMNVAVLVYIFKSLKAELKSMNTKVDRLDDNRVKLVHKEECRYQRDELSKRVASLEKRIHLIETNGITGGRHGIS